MSLSIPRRYGRFPGPRGERKSMCDYCSLAYYRSELRRDAAGYLRCRDDGCNGKDIVTLDRENAQAGAKIRTPRPPPERW